ncbi:MAG: LptF/LptG family permease [Muribaculaceae bacterium]|nr:LptF/LptG family permease [Muribaculaceae bacterium]
MYRPKRLYTFMLQTFLPVFVMTFFICLFIVLMQFLWRYIDDLVGKGLEITAIGELFFYAALTMVPMALPLAILLASLMTFGNLGEKFELTAMKASGVSLLKAMRPLIIFILLIAGGAFFFQNNILPVAQVKMYTLLYSMKQKSPEMEIPEKAFYDQIPGINIYVEEKDKETGVLRELMIYDMSGGTDNTRIIVADSGKISLTPDKTKLLLNIYQGEQFENLRSTTAGVQSNNLPYRRETFAQKDILIAFDANFNRMDESAMRKQYVGKNITELHATIDSLQARVDSTGLVYASELKEKPYFNLQYYRTLNTPDGTVRTTQSEVALDKPLDTDSLFHDNSGLDEATIINQALYKARNVKMDYEYKSKLMEEDRKQIRRHGIELHKKFTLSFACIIFFFIGAPLGAIIRKGGIGLPLVVSVILFIIYYIIDNTGYKMAKDGRVSIIEGMWLSSAVLLPLGIFFTYKAVHDSGVFNIDAYKAFWVKLRGKHKRTLEPKEFTLDEVTPEGALSVINAFDSDLQALRESYRRMFFLHKLYARLFGTKQSTECMRSMNVLIDYLANSRRHQVIAVLNRYPYKITPRDFNLLADNNEQLRQWFENEAGKDPDNE